MAKNMAKTRQQILTHEFPNNRDLVIGSYYHHHKL